jgi:hypothetical protein
VSTSALLGFAVTQDVEPESLIVELERGPLPGPAIAAQHGELQSPAGQGQA